MSQKIRKKVQVWIYFYHPQKQSYFFLILKTRPERKSFWQPVTGSVEEGESLVEAALREALEETGLSFQTQPSQLGNPFTFESRGEINLETAFSLEISPPFAEDQLGAPLVKLDPHEHTEYQWVNVTQAVQMIAYPSNIQMLQLLNNYLI